MATLTFYNGVKEIGGNQILLEEKNTKIFFDFGFPFQKYSKYFAEFVSLRPGEGILDALEFQFLPPIEGIFRKDLVFKEEIQAKLKKSPHYKKVEKIDGVFLSHAHFDHSGFISVLDLKIPLISTLTTAFVLKAIQDTGGRETYLAIQREISKREDGREVLMAKRGCFYQREFQIVGEKEIKKEQEKFWEEIPRKEKKDLRLSSLKINEGKVGDLRFLFFPLDHSIFGSGAFAIETESGWIVYTGDFRFHGKLGGKTREFLEKVKKLKPLALIVEGTNIQTEKSISEEEVFQNCLKAIKKTKNLVIADFGPRNIERLLYFLEIARETGRYLVILTKDAKILEAMHLSIPSEIPDVFEEKRIRVYLKTKSQLPFWEEKLLLEKKACFVNPKEIKENQDKFILCFSFFDFNELISLEPQKRSLYIYSTSEPHNEEELIDLERIRNWISHFQLEAVGLPPSGEEISKKEEKYHASGHASGKEIIEMIKEINPKYLFPVHTHFPQLFEEKLKGTSIKILFPQEGESIVL